LKLLLDTHVFLWAITKDPRLTTEKAAAFIDEGNELFLSIASVWEMLIKVGIGKLPLPKPSAAYITKQLDKNRINTLPIRAAHLAQLEKLPPLHKDPFDRMIVAQAQAEGYPVLSSDRGIYQYDVEII